MIDLGKHSVLGIDIDAVDYRYCVEQVMRFATDRRAFAISALAVHGVMTGNLDDEQRYRLNELDMVVPDGQPVRWALRWLHGVRLGDRVYGPNLMLKVCEAAAERDLPIFLFGGTNEILSKLQTNLQALFPALSIAGNRASKFRQMSSGEVDEVANEIRDSGAKITFVGLGCPRQEVWIYEMKERLPMPLLAVGAAFPFHAGLLPQAPAWMQKFGLEWCFRLAMEPRRLWWRYATLNPLFLAMVVAQASGLRRFNEPVQPPVVPMRYG